MSTEYTYYEYYVTRSHGLSKKVISNTEVTIGYMTSYSSNNKWIYYSCIQNLDKQSYALTEAVRTSYAPNTNETTNIPSYSSNPVTQPNNNSNTTTVDNSHWETYYRDTYRRYESLAESTYNTLTNLGSRAQDNNGNISGSTGDFPNIGGSIVSLKMNLSNAQREMRNTRIEAQQNYGISIPQSRWETATVNIGF